MQLSKELFTKNSRRWWAGLLSAQIGAAAAVGISDSDLAKKPEWYQEAVHDLETAVKRTNKLGFIEKTTVLDCAHNILQKFIDLNNPELLWRLMRVLVEKSELCPDAREKELLLKEAVEVGTKSMLYEGKPLAGLHKWYAIALSKLMHYDKDVRKNSQHLIKEHLAKAIEIDPSDPFAWQQLGLENYELKDYKEAFNCLQKAEEISPNFCAANHYYLAKVYQKLREKTKAVEEFKAVFKISPKYRIDVKARVDARRVLNGLGINSSEYDPNQED